MKYNFIILLFFFVTSVFIFEKSVSSQGFDFESMFNSDTGLPMGIVEQFSIEQIPEIPSPGENVFIRITSFSTNLNGARITWTQDGETLASGIGIVSQNIISPLDGRPSVIQIRIEKEDGGVVTETISLNPAHVDLFYEANTYTPPFYKGKRLFTSESEATVVAIPHFSNDAGQRIPDENLVYTWTINGVVQQNFSGRGKNTLFLQGSLIERPIRIRVDVTSSSSTMIATNTIVLSSQNPQFILYENNPVFGIIYEQAIRGNFLLERPQVDFEGVPYFFSSNFKSDGSIIYNWTINGIRPQNKPPNENYIVLRNLGNEEGLVTISTTANHQNNILQQATSTLRLNLKKFDNLFNNETITF